MEVSNIIVRFRIKRAHLWISLLSSLFLLPSYTLALTKPISLSEAEYLAINNSPELQKFEANTHALNNQAIVDGQLSDPQLIVGAANVPTNSFSFTQDDMTMINVGLQQTFPRGHSLAIKSKQTKALATAEERKEEEQTAMLLRNVRETWLDLYYWTQAAHIVRENQNLYRRLLQSTESQYSTGKGNQSDVLQLQVEVSRLNIQNTQIQEQIEVLRAQLGRWIGQAQANRPLVQRLPKWPNPLPMQTLETRLSAHPLLTADLANIEAARDAVAYAKEQYKPGWMLNVGYGIRQGTYMDGSGQERPNFFGAQVTIDLPIFPGNRQDKQVNVSADQLEAAKFDRDAHYRDLLKELTIQYAMWRNLSKREEIYHQHLYPEARQNSKAALLAYQSTTSSLSTVLRAYSNQLTIKLEQIQIEVERAKARVALLYLEGVTQ